MLSMMKKRRWHFLKKIKKAVDHITHLNIKMSTFDLNSRLCLPLPDTKQQKQLTTKTTYNKINIQQEQLMSRKRFQE